MTDYLKGKWLQASGRIKIALLLLLGILGLSVVLALAAGALDSDSDGISDSYEQFFGLDYTNAADALLNYDADILLNIQESEAGVDPFQKDTDSDAWADGIDLTISRAFLNFEPRFIYGDHYLYPMPSYIKSVYKTGGEFTNGNWHVESPRVKESKRAKSPISNFEFPVSSLVIELDRSLLTNNLLLEIELIKHRASGLFIDLVNTQGVVVARNLCGNLSGGNGERDRLLLELPLADDPQAQKIVLLCDKGEATVFEIFAYIDSDHDALDLEQEAQIGSSDTPVSGWGQDDDDDEDGEETESKSVFRHEKSVVPTVLWRKNSPATERRSYSGMLHGREAAWDRPKIVLDLVFDWPDPFSPALSALRLFGEYRILPTDALWAAARHTRNQAWSGIRKNSGPEFGHSTSASGSGIRKNSGPENREDNEREERFEFYVRQTIAVLDASSNVVRSLVADFSINPSNIWFPGHYAHVSTETAWNGKGAGETLLPNGIYTYRITGTYLRTHKVPILGGVPPKVPILGGVPPKVPLLGGVPPKVPLLGGVRGGSNAQADTKIKEKIIAVSSTLEGAVVLNATPPVTEAVVTPPTNQNGWHNQDVTIILSAQDSMSGVAGTFYSIDNAATVEGTNATVQAEGIHSVRYWSVDNIGNTEPANELVIRIDKTPPEIAFGSQSPPPNKWGWNNSAVTITYAVSDAVSAPDAVIGGYEPDTVATEGTNQSVSGAVTDLAGNSASVTVAGINIDLAPPTIAASTSGTQGDNGWFVGEATVSYVVADAFAGVDLELGDHAADILWQGGNQTAEGNVYDKAGNRASTQVTNINVDWTPPSMDVAVSPAGNAAGWHSADPTVTFSAADQPGLSGVAFVTPPITVTNEGAGQVVVGTARDVAGNSSTTNITVSLDKTAPVISVESRAPANEHGWNRGPVTVAYTASDALSGVNTALAGYEPDTVTTEGANQSVSASATDNAGNMGAVTVTGINIDLTEPAIVSFTPANGETTSDPRQPITVVFNDILSGADPESVALTVYGSNVTAAVVSATGATYQTAQDYPEGDPVVTVSLADNAGNTNAGHSAFTVDSDGISNAWEILYFGHPDYTPQDDPDSDGLSNLDEYRIKTNPADEDSDDDGFTDGLEVQTGFDPNDPYSVPFLDVSGTLSYVGEQRGPIFVLATAISNVWEPVGFTIVHKAGPYTITNLPSLNSYWVKAFRDLDGNRSNDFWEALGEYSNVLFNVSNDVAGVDFILADPDTDADGLPDWWEVQFLGGIDAVAEEDSDSDGVNNVAEYSTKSDPADSDTDNDGFSDSFDSNAISRAVIELGAPESTSGDDYVYALPQWIERVWQEGGEWSTWYVNPSVPDNIGRLLVAFDRNVLTNNVVLQIDFFDYPGSSLFIDLLDTNLVTVATNLYGNVMEGSNFVTRKIYGLPITNYANATTLGVRRGTGEISINNALIYVDQDFDGLDSSQEVQVGTPDNNPDFDADNAGDGLEVFVGTDPLSSTSYPVNVSGTVSYSGGQTGYVWAIAATNADDWNIKYSRLMPDPGMFQSSEYVITNVPNLTNYWLKAYRDSNGNSLLDPLESRGGYEFNPAYLVDDVAGINIVLHDPDNDGDGMGDWWEVKHFGDLSRTGAGDPDGDGLSDLVEYQNVTSPNSVDTDSDGMGDWAEVSHGISPLTGNVYAALPFTEAFETNTVSAGDIAGQNGWEASAPGIGLVQSGRARGGDQALGIMPSRDTSAVKHHFAGVNKSVVWSDFYTQPARRELEEGPPVDAASSAAFYVDAGGRVVVYDGALASNNWVTLTNHAVIGRSEWVRFSVKQDFGSRTWTLRLNGRPIAQDMPFITNATEYSGIRFRNAKHLTAYVDDFMASETLPFASQYSVAGSVSYSGGQTGLIKVVAVTNADSWDVTYNAEIPSPDAYSIASIPSLADYWVKAYRDSNGNGVRDATEAVGSHDLNPVYAAENLVAIDIVLHDPDNDGDGMGDWWEVKHFGDLSRTGAGDSDGDGLSDLVEYQNVTSPNSVDTDSDGMGDWAEVAHGLSPTTSNVYAALPFTEAFETNTVSVGDIAGQNGWEASAPGIGLVQSGRARGGDQALEIMPSRDTSAVKHHFAGVNKSVVWSDFYTQPARRELKEGPPVDAASSVAFYVDAGGRVVVYDGALASNNWVTLTNHPVIEPDTWVRFTIKQDFNSQTWSLWFNETNIAQNIAFANPAREYSVAGFKNAKYRSAYVDDLTVSETAVFVEDSDGDGMPDWWETQWFGNTTTANATTDYDSDGLLDFGEYQRGTDPTDPLSGNRTIYVNAGAGNDSHDGFAASWDGVHGPKQTINGGLDAALAGDTVHVAAGTYFEDVNISGTEVTVTGEGTIRTE